MCVFGGCCKGIVICKCNGVMALVRGADNNEWPGIIIMNHVNSQMAHHKCNRFEAHRIWGYKLREVSRSSTPITTSSQMNRIRRIITHNG